MLYYNIPKERVFRKYNKYRYLNKPDFDNWIKYFKPVFELKKSKDKLDEEKKEESQQQEMGAQPNSSQIAPQEKEKEQRRKQIVILRMTSDRILIPRCLCPPSCGSRKESGLRTAVSGLGFLQWSLPSAFLS